MQILILILALTACGKKDNTPCVQNGDEHGATSGKGSKVRVVDAALEPYVQDLESEIGFQIAYAVRLIDLPNGYAGLATYWQNGEALLEIDTDFYNSATYNQIHQVVAHEMGHLSMARGHDDSTITLDGQTVPKTVMHHMAFSRDTADFYMDHKNYYMDELFLR